MFADRLDVPGILKLGQTMAKVTNSRNYEFLAAQLSAHVNRYICNSTSELRTSAEGTSAGDLIQATV